MIPKKIHYCWFGGAEKPEIVVRCMASWKKYMPGYEIIEWNESNYDIHKSRFMEQAYEYKKWAFVSDYARFDVLAEYGGIYFDTDVELLKPIPEEILAHRAFTGFESAGQVSPGLVFAAEPQFPITVEILHQYQKMRFLEDGRPCYKTVNNITTDLLKNYAEIKPNEFQIVEDLAIYPSSYFCGYDQDIHEVDIQPETISVHHYASTWKNKSFKTKVQDCLKRYFGIQFYRRLLKVKRKFLGVYSK